MMGQGEGRSRAYSWAIMMVAAILAFALGLRLYHLGFPGLWTDEFHIALEQGAAPSLNPVHDIRETYVDFVLRQPFAKYGNGDFVLRLPSVLVAMGSLVLLLVVGRGIAPRLGVAALALVAVLPVHVRYSQEARYYVWMYVGSLLLLLALQRLRRSATWREGALLAAAVAVTSLTQTTCIVVPWVVVGLGCATLLRPVLRRHWRPLAGGMVVGLVLSLPAYLDALRMLRDSLAGKAMHPNPDEVLQAIRPWLYTEAVAQLNSSTFGPFSTGPEGWVDWATIAVWVLGAGWLLVRHRAWGVMLLGCWLVLTSIIFRMSVGTIFVHQRYLFSAVPFGHLILAAGFVALAGGVERLAARFVRNPRAAGAVAAAATAVVALAMVVPGLRSYYRETKYSVNVSAYLMAHIAETSRGSDIAVVFPRQNDSTDKRYAGWYIGKLPALRGRTVEVDANSSATARRAVEGMAAETGGDLWVGMWTGQKARVHDRNLETAFAGLEQEHRAVSVQHDDGKRLYVARSAWLADAGTTQGRVAEVVDFLRGIEATWDSRYPTRADVSATKARKIREQHAGAALPPGAEEEVRLAEDFVLARGWNQYQRAGIHMARRQWAGAMRAAEKGIRERPEYPLNYVMVAQASENRFYELGDPRDLDHAIDQQTRARKAGAALPPWTDGYFAGLVEMRREVPDLEALAAAARVGDTARFAELEKEYTSKPRRGWKRYQAIKAALTK